MKGLIFEKVTEKDFTEFADLLRRALENGFTEVYLVNCTKAVKAIAEGQKKKFDVVITCKTYSIVKYMAVREKHYDAYGYLRISPKATQIKVNKSKLESGKEWYWFTS